MRRLIRLGFAAAASTLFALAAVTTANAVDLEILGGKGGGPFRIRCEPGSFITGFEGHTGAYVDHFRIQCGSFDRVTRRITPRGALPIQIGNSGGGGPSSASCPAGWAAFAMELQTTKDGFVHHIAFRCAPPVGPETIWRTYGPTTPVATSGTGSFSEHYDPQACPPFEFAVGIQGRSGLYVDALGLICEPLPAAPAAAPPPPPQPQAISPNFQPNTTIQGKPLGKQAIVGPSPPPLAAPPPPLPGNPPPVSDDGKVATRTPPAKQATFSGTWDTRTDKNWSYVITFTQDGRNVSGRYVAQDGSKGQISGRVRDGVLEFKWEQDGGYRGTGQFALAADGNSFSGSYRTDPNKKITDPSLLQGIWNGKRR
jgi:hypothetical protein